MLVVSCADDGDDVDKVVGPKDNERSKQYLHTMCVHGGGIKSYLL
jgi:hypothetical protein